MNWYSIFYLITRADGIRSFFDTTSNIFTWIAVLSFLVWVIMLILKGLTISEEKLESEEDQKSNSEYRSVELIRKGVIKIFYPALVLSLLTWFGYVATPTKKEALFIVAGGAVGNFITSDTSATQIPSDITNFLHLSLKNEVMSLEEEARRELGVVTKEVLDEAREKSAKEELIDRVKTMGKEELIRFLENDTTIVK